MVVYVSRTSPTPHTDDGDVVEYDGVVVVDGGGVLEDGEDDDVPHSNSPH